MVDDVRNITETAESKEALDRSRLARERREVEQRKRLDELRAHAAAAQAQREKRDEDRRKRQAEQRAKDDDRRVQVEERKRAIWEASISRREALLQRERDRAERLERARAARSAPRPAFAFGSSTPRLLDPLDSAGFFWAARRAASTTNVMYVSAPLTRRASALQLDTSDTDTKDEQDRSPAPPMWSSVARRRTDLVPTVPLGRAPECRSGETTPGSRPGSALSNAPGVVRRPASTPRKPRPASIAGTGVNTPRGGVGAGGDIMSQSLATTPSVSRDSTVVVVASGDVPRRPASTPRRPRPTSMHASHKPSTPATPGEGKPPLHRKPKPSKEHDKSGRGKSLSVSPGRALSPARVASKDSSLDKDLPAKPTVNVEVPGEEEMAAVVRSHVSAEEVTQKLEALQVNSDLAHDQVIIENKESVDVEMETKVENVEMVIEEKTTEPVKPVEVLKPVERKEEREEKREEKKEPSQEKTEDNEMTASMRAGRITTEEQAKAALAERRRRAREELERQAELERQRLQREAEEEAERQRLEEERQRREEEEARELAQLQRRMEEEKLRKAIEAQQQLERDEAERKTREEADRQARLREDEEKRKAAEEAEKLRREEAEKEEKERLARKQRVEAIMARTRLRKAEEEKKSQDKPPNQTSAVPVPASAQESIPASVPVEESPAGVATSEPVPVAVAEEMPPAPAHDNGNVTTGDLLGFDSSQVNEPNALVEENTQTNASAEVKETVVTNNGNVTADLLGLSEQNNTEDKIQEQSTQKQIDNSTNNTNQNETNNGNVHSSQTVSGIGLIAADFLQSERAANENQTKIADDFTSHNGHGTLNHPLTLQNAI